MEWNHVGVYPYLFKFRNNILLTRDFSHRENQERIFGLMKDMSGCIGREPISKKTHTMYIDGIKQDNVDNKVIISLLNEGNPSKIKNSIMIFPKNIEPDKLWWLNKMIGFARYNSRSYHIMGQTMLSDTDLKKVTGRHPGYKSVPYPFSIANSETAMPFYKNNKRMERCLAHSFTGNYNICFGNYSVDIDDALTQQRWDKLAAVLIEFAGRFNPRDPLGKHYYELMEPIPRICTKCGSKDSSRFYDHAGVTYCRSCYFLGECKFCGCQINIANKSTNQNLCSDCETILHGRIDNMTCECGSEKVDFYSTEDNKIKALCSECFGKIRFVRMSKSTQNQPNFRRTW